LALAKSSRLHFNRKEVRTMHLSDLVRDRKALKQRWYDEGIFGRETIPDHLQAGVGDHADTRMIFHSDSRPVSTTIAEAYSDSERMAAALHALGIRAGDVVGVMLPTWYDTAIAYHAVLKMGAVLLPMVTIFGPAEMGFVLTQSHAKALIIPDHWRNHDFVARFHKAGKLPALEHVIVVGDEVPDTMVSWDEMMKTARGTCPPATIDPDTVCSIIFTSGTTSAPKGVQHTHNTLLADIGPKAVSLTGAARQPETVFLNCWAPGHIGGLFYLTQPFMLGTAMVYMDQWVPKVAAALVEKYRVTASGGTPVFLTSLLAAAKDAGYNLSSLTSFGLGGASVSPEHVRLAMELGFRSGRGYGSTEHPTISSAPIDAPDNKRANTDGRVTPNNEVRILDEEGNDLPVGTDGEIVSRGPELFIGYLDHELDIESFVPGGWFRTGDIGHLDTEGYLTITDRKKDIIIRGGENISSKAVEDVLLTHLAVLDAAVVAMPDATLGERICAFVVLREGNFLTLDDVATHFQKAGVTRQKTPEKLVVIDEFPRTPSGKIKKFELRQSLRL
jgi:acyl-coenzyme A synthetase/AMP-(fatty) acid ligase